MRTSFKMHTPQGYKKGAKACRIAKGKACRIAKTCQAVMKKVEKLINSISDSSTLREVSRTVLKIASMTDNTKFAKLANEIWRGAKVVKSRAQKTGVLMFATRRELDNFFRVGTPIRKASPCVDRAKLRDDHPLVYEEWTKHTTTKTLVRFRCRRSKLREHVVIGKRTRDTSNRKEYIGCECPAKYTVRKVTDGYIVVFKGTHNHDVQNAYGVNYVNPIRVCRTIRELVDEKLFHGATNLTRMLNDVHAEMCGTRQQHRNFQQQRNFFMSIFLTQQQIKNRRQSLCLDDVVEHANDAKAVEELVRTWERELGKDSPIRYLKQV